MNLFKWIFGVIFFLFFIVACGDSGGSSPGNWAPVAINLVISDVNGGTVKIGDTLTASYQYQDADGDLEGQTIIQWGRNGYVIEGAESLNYVVTKEDASQSLSFSVMPISTSGNQYGREYWSQPLSVDCQRVVDVLPDLADEGLSTCIRDDANRPFGLCSVWLDSDTLGDCKKALDACVSEVKGIGCEGELGIRNIDALSNFQNLQQLYLTSQKDLIEVDLSKFINLENLNFHYTKIAKIKFGENTPLKYIIIHGSDLIDLDLSLLKNLKNVYIYNSPIESVDITENRELTSVYIHDANLNSFITGNNSVLESLTVSQSLVSEYYSSITDFNTDGLVELKELDVFGIHIAHLDISKNSKLNSLNASYSNLDSLDTSNNLLLEELYVSETNIERLDVSNNTNLKNLSLSSAPVSSLDLRENHVLDSLIIAGTQISILDITNNPALITLNANNTSIDKIDLSANLLLENLYVHHTNIIDLDISNNPNLLVVEGYRSRLNAISGIERIENLSARLDFKDNPLNTTTITYLQDLKDMHGFTNLVFHVTDRYSKISDAGELLYSGADSWACIRDNESGLMWEVKTNDGGLRDRNWSYMNTTSLRNWNPISEGIDRGQCLSSDVEGDGIFCDTETYVASVNQTALCGVSNWRVPAKNELKDIVYCSNWLYQSRLYDNQTCGETGSYDYPVIDVSFFPNTISGDYWTADPYSAGDVGMWFINYLTGASGYNIRGEANKVRLVSDE